MKVYVKFITSIFFRSFLFVFLVITSLVVILNLLSELDFFKNENVSIGFTIFLSFLNSPSLIFEMFPFIILIAIQLFFVKLFENKEIEIFKYSGLKNSNLLLILSSLSLITGIFIILIFYNLSSNLKNIYLELKSNYTNDGKYLAVINKNGLWIKDKINDSILITNAASVEGNFLKNSFITEFDKQYNVVRNIQSKYVDIQKKEWKIIDAKIYRKNNYEIVSNLVLKTNFDVQRIQTLYSNLSALNLFELSELRKNYKKLNYSIIDIDLHILKIMTFPIYLLLMALFGSLIMLNIKQLKGTTFKISIGLFLSVIIYYLNNFSFVLGSTEKISLIFSIFIPLFLLTIVNGLMLNGVNEK